MKVSLSFITLVIAGTLLMPPNAAAQSGVGYCTWCDAPYCVQYAFYGYQWCRQVYVNGREACEYGGSWCEYASAGEVTLDGSVRFASIQPTDAVSNLSVNVGPTPSTQGHFVSAWLVQPETAYTRRDCDGSIVERKMDLLLRERVRALTRILKI